MLPPLRLAVLSRKHEGPIAYGPLARLDSPTDKTVQSGNRERRVGEKDSLSLERGWAAVSLRSAQTEYDAEDRPRTGVHVLQSSVLPKKCNEMKVRCSPFL